MRFSVKLNNNRESHTKAKFKRYNTRENKKIASNFDYHKNCTTLWKNNKSMESLSEKNFSEISMPVPWGTLAGRWYGDQLSRPILALHGWLDNCGTFAKIAPLLTPYASLLCIDLPGHGYSSHLPAGILYSNMEFVRVILRLMDAYNWDKISLLGHSMGGTVCFHFASIYPERVDMLITLDVIKQIYFTPDIMHRIYSHLIERALIDNERIVLQTPMNEPPSYSFEDCEHLLYNGSHKSVDLENCKYILERNISKSVKYPNKYYFSRDGRIKYAYDLNPNDEMSKEMALRICRVPIPFLVMKGGASRNPSALDKPLDGFFLEKNPYFELHEVPNAQHHLHLNNPEPVAALIISFLQKYRPIEQMRQEEQNKRKVKARL